mmetsp:Transcript_4155/g.5767  ORF Transcript_4155/g.5767 Transcript_4155/m.5767 type:complete len:482 (-) Transcript_4155:16-1461(-)
MQSKGWLFKLIGLGDRANVTQIKGPNLNNNDYQHSYEADMYGLANAVHHLLTGGVHMEWERKQVLQANSSTSSSTETYQLKSLTSITSNRYLKGRLAWAAFFDEVLNAPQGLHGAGFIYNNYPKHYKFMKLQYGISYACTLIQTMIQNETNDSYLKEILMLREEQNFCGKQKNSNPHNYLFFSLSQHNGRTQTKFEGSLPHFQENEFKVSKICSCVEETKHKLKQVVYEIQKRCFWENDKNEIVERDLKAEIQRLRSLLHDKKKSLDDIHHHNIHLNEVETAVRSQEHAHPLLQKKSKTLQTPKLVFVSGESDNFQMKRPEHIFGASVQRQSSYQGLNKGSNRHGGKSSIYENKGFGMNNILTQKKDADNFESHLTASSDEYKTVETSKPPVEEYNELSKDAMSLLHTGKQLTPKLANYGSYPSLYSILQDSKRGMEMIRESHQENNSRKKIRSQFESNHVQLSNTVNNTPVSSCSKHYAW